MASPFEQTFSSREELLEALYSYTEANHYTLTTRSSNRDRSIYLQCDRGGIFKDRINAAPGEKRKKGATKQMDCPLKIYAICPKKGPNAGRWLVKDKDLQHNHDLCEDLIGHPAARRHSLKPEQRDLIERLLNYGVAPHRIMSILHAESPDNLIISEDIYNLRKAFNREKLNGRTQMEYLQEQLVKEEWLYKFRVDKENYMEFFIFAHPDSIAYAKRYNIVFVLDCTYKTNRFGMPLLHIIGISPNNISFSVGFCFMKNEDGDSYLWALHTIFSWLEIGSNTGRYPILCTDRDLALVATIRDYFKNHPHLLCRWHINIRVLENCRKYFPDNTVNEGKTEVDPLWDRFLTDWQLLLNSPTEIQYEANLRAFKEKYCSIPAAIQYLEGIWLCHKEKIVSCWTNKYMHLGNSSTSRVEGSHAYVKRYIGESTCNIPNSWIRIREAIIAQHKKLRTASARDNIHSSFHHELSLFSALRKRTSKYSLDLLYDQVQYAKRATKEAPLRICNNGFTRIWGLLCKHRITTFLQLSQPIPLTEIHSFWKIDIAPDNSEYQQILDPRLPVPRQPKRIPYSNQIVVCNGNKSTQVESNKPATRAPSTCSACRGIGHIMTSNRCPLRQQKKV